MLNTGKSWNGYIWLRDGLIPAQSAVLEALWAFAWINFMLASNPESTTVRFNFGWVFALLVIPAVVGRWLERAGAQAHGQDASPWLRRRGRRLILLGLCSLLFIAFVKAEALPGPSLVDWRWVADVFVPWTSLNAANHAGLVLFAWLSAAALLVRGVWLALTDITADSAAGWFLAGLGAFLLLFFVLVKSPPPPSYGSDRAWLGPLLALYLFGGTGWLALVRQQYLEEETFRGAAGPLNLNWLAVFSALSGLMLGIAAIVAVLGSRVLLALEQGGIWLATALWTAATFVVLWLVNVVLWLLRLLPPLRVEPHIQPLPRPRSLAPGNLPPPLIRLPSIHLPFDVPIALLFLGLVGVMAALLVLSHRSRDFTPAGDEERSSLWSWSLLWRQLSQALRRRPRSRTGPSNPAAAPAEPETSGGSVRALYRAVLWWSREHGRPRLPAETPAEFESALVERLPADLAAGLTDAYIRTRYGGHSPSDAELARLAAGWQEASALEPEEGQVSPRPKAP